MALFLFRKKKVSSRQLSFLLVAIAHLWHHFGPMSILLWQGTYFTERLLIKTSSNRRQLHDVTAASAICKNYSATWLFIATWFEVAFYGAQGDFRYSTV